jgi:hypothetical protein
MKKTLLILILAVTSLTLKAQNSIRNWEKSAASGYYSWLLTTGGTVNSCAYNPINGNLYVADRGSNIYILNSATGAQTGILSKSGTSGSYLFSKVRVSSTGEIFAVSLSTTGGYARVYYWATEATAPVLLGDLTNGITILAAERAGDAFAVSGSGTGATLFLSGNGGTSVQVITTSGALPANFSKTKNIAVTTTANARSCISPVTTGTSSDLWISAPTVAKRLMTSAGVDTKVLATTILTAPGTYTDVTPAGSISKNFSSLEYFEVGAKKFLATTGANDAVGASYNGEGLALLIYDITDVDAIKLIEATKLTNTFVANGNATCDIAIKKVLNVDLSYTLTFFQLITNNGVASYTLNFKADGTLPVSLSSFNAALTNSQNSLTWTTASENNSAGFDVESSTDGATFNKIGFVASKNDGNSSSVLTYSFQDKLATAVTTYYRLKQVDKDGKSTYSEIKSVKNPLLADQSPFTVYPNPTSDYVNITGANADGVTVQLFTTAGAEVNTSKLLNAGKLNMTSLNPGTYVLRVSKNGTLLQTTKLVKQ